MVGTAADISTSGEQAHETSSLHCGDCRSGTDRHSGARCPGRPGAECDGDGPHRQAADPDLGQDLDLGTILLSGAGAWGGAVVGVSQAGVLSCANANVTCSGAVQQAKYNVRGTNNQLVTIIAPNVTLTNANNPLQTLLMTVSSPGTVMLTSSGAPGNDFNLGGSITVASTTGDGVYSGTFNVTVHY